MKEKEIRWYKFQPSDKNRLVLILTCDSILEYLGEFTLTPITSTIRDIPSELFLSREDGLPKDGAVNYDYIQTVSKGKIGSRITTLPPKRWSRCTKPFCLP